MLFARLASLTLIVIMMLTFVDVIGRTFFGRALVGTVESVELLMGMLVFSGLAYTELQRKHIVVETFQSLLPGKLHRLSNLINLLLAISVTGLLAWQLCIKTLEIFEDQEYTQILEIPYWPTAIIMSIGLILFLLTLILRLLHPHKGDGGYFDAQSADANKGDGGYFDARKEDSRKEDAPNGDGAHFGENRDNT